MNADRLAVTAMLIHYMISNLVSVGSRKDDSLVSSAVNLINNVY
jgi:hypothetical protein